ncbi:hypothetical protein [Xanthomonas rydalmerensis]|uniref:Restriction endonuclease n=1 Tax=Xanthomonas rydalmerensis TaxID=3046274 RepID=A0ABZ0JPF5_9XANT|nr:hypothetical protein [Xanthomonas sp. DM-2023]WOS41697.1 hypothetical protein QN243_04330 [Xanthomonas sp. DM-2023]WOS45883.1 hypothetical protein QN242_04330 [Xanthomonas sp. DM-2023]WOS50062.1 hypothetical protein QN240_04330 [Xanthomonas sp. DM-2023]WOS54241.1 hypothetical protein QN244_04330 [Xanthomonas sp. DM-2023]WOS58424.1 hypothetical protein QN245_04330 [Xanthomonas sp. DM-2023]
MNNLKFASFADAGNIEKERLVLNAITDLKVGEYAIFSSKSGPTGGATSGKKSAYWFPDKDLKKGDVVVLYTKQGRASEKLLDGDRTAHFFYWGNKETLWSSESIGAVVVKVENWNFYRPPLAPLAE